MPVRVLHHHDRGIDQHADGQRDAAERHDVGGDVQVIHRDERRRDRHRQRQNRHQRRSEVEQEDDDDDRDDDRFFDQRAAKRADRLAESASSGRRSARSARPRGSDGWTSCELRLDAIDDLQRVLAEPHHDDAADRPRLCRPARRHRAGGPARVARRRRRRPAPACRARSTPSDTFSMSSTDFR